MPLEPKKNLPNSNSEVSLKASDSHDKLDGTPRRKKKPQFKKLSIDVLAPLIVDRTDLQSPIKVDNPEFVALAPMSESINSPRPGDSVNNLEKQLEKEKHANEEEKRDNQVETKAMPPSESDGKPSVNVSKKDTETTPPSGSEEKATISKDDTGTTGTTGTAGTDFAAATNATTTKHIKQTSAPASTSAPVITQVQPSIITQVTPQTAVHTNLAAAKSRAAAAAAKPKLNTENPKPQSKSLLQILFPCLCFPSPKAEQVPLQTISVQSTPQPIDSSKPSSADLGNRLLPPQSADNKGKKCLVLDLDETLLHSSFKPVDTCDFTIQVEIDGILHTVYVLKRPHVELFLDTMAREYELVVFTASLSKYADPVLDILDPKRLIKYRLFRESCTHHRGNYIKDLGLLGRDLSSTIIIDNSPTCYMFHPSNAVPIASWFDDKNDQELLDLIPFLQDLNLVEDVRAVLDTSQDQL